MGAIARDVDPGEVALHTLRPFGTFRNKTPSSPFVLRGQLALDNVQRDVDMDLMAKAGRDVIDNGLSCVSGWAATRSKSIPALMVASVHAGRLILRGWTVGPKSHSST